MNSFRHRSLIPFEAKHRILSNQDLKHEYLPIAGLDSYLSAARNLIFGSESSAIQEGRVASVQTLSGTGALHLGAALLAKFLPSSPSKKVYVSSPPYVNHLPILHHASLPTGLYPYYSPITQGLDIDSLVGHLKSIPDGSIVLLHACAHNPTGVDPTQDQWKKIAQVMKAKRQLPFFDCAYQGFSSGNIEEDAWTIRYFVQQGFSTIIIAQSFAKNFGLYGERAGCLHVVTSSSDIASRVLSQLTILQRVEISTPPAFGARIVSEILNDSQLYVEWQRDLKTMADRIIAMRIELRKNLEAIEAPGSWSHITDQTGMFCYTGLTQAQVSQLRQSHHIYMTSNGRISIAGLNEQNVRYVAESFKDVILRASL